MSDSQKEKKIKKVLLMGLDNSGKTSILISLSKNCNILSFCSLKPTNRIAITNIETEEQVLNIWDYGGQEAYRKEYLENLGKNLELVDKIIFVIDVQDVERYNLALEYLKKIVEIIFREKGKVKFSIFLHKYDPNVEDCRGLENIDKLVNDMIVEPIKSFFPSELEYDFHKTCIYSVFRKMSL